MSQRPDWILRYPGEPLPIIPSSNDNPNNNNAQHTSVVWSDVEVPDEAYWVEVGGESRITPYGMHRFVNQNEVEVVNSITDEDNHPKRWVVVRDGQHEAWVKAADQDEYGYEVRPDERVSETELEAITLKQTAIRDGSSVSVAEAQVLVESGAPDQLRHALVALYYAAEADPGVTDEDVDRLREIMHEHTRHIDTSHMPTLLGILEDIDDDDEQNSTI